MGGERNLADCGNGQYGESKITKQEYIEIVADLITGHFQPVDIIFKYSVIDYSFFDNLIALIDKLYEEFGKEELISLRAKILFSELILYEYNFQARLGEHSLEDLEIIAKIDTFLENQTWS